MVLSCNTTWAAADELNNAAGQSVVSPTVTNKPKQTAQAAVPARDLQPITHAHDAGLTTCLAAVETESRKLIDTEHTAASSWSKSAPNGKPFFSAIGMKYKNVVAPNVLSLLFAVPSADQCFEQSIQIYPINKKCAEIEKNLLVKGSKIGQLQMISYIESANEARIALIPGPGASCTVVTLHRN